MSETSTRPASSDANLGLRRKRRSPGTSDRTDRTDLKFKPGQRIYPCKTCGASMPHAITGRVRQTCNDCKGKLKAEAAVALRLTVKPPINCIDCNVEVPVGWHGAGGRKRCDKCAKERARVIQKRMAGERRAIMRGAESEKFEDQEIFERDGWKCQICRKRINKKLKHPHPMSASLDHIIPLTKGGSHTRAGVQATHLTCNLRKYNLGGGEQLLLIG